MSRTDKDRPIRVRAAQDEPAVTHDHRAAPELCSDVSGP